jgi:hypothetical protein
VKEEEDWRDGLVIEEQEGREEMSDCVGEGERSISYIRIVG